MPQTILSQSVESVESPAQEINVLEDRESLLDLLGSTLACRLSEELMLDLERSPLYSINEGACGATTELSSDQLQVYADAACQTPVSVSEIAQQVFCANTLDALSFGDGSGLTQEAGHSQWLLNPGNRYDVGAASLRTLQQPYMQRLTYKEIATPAGSCHLEMRVYKNDLAETDLKPMIAFHGGSWRARGFGFFGLEMTIPQLTQRGYVVFAPFYRLLDSKESTPACHNASIEEVKADAADALRWVIDNAGLYGASDYPTVFGQSAGAHLAVSLAVEQAQQVANAVLFYPPTDFTEFALRVLDGSYTDEQGLDILEAVLGAGPEELDISRTPIPENTYPIRVLENPSAFPPMFMLHGLADELVEATQSTRLCSALSGDLEAVPGRDFWLQQPDLRIVRSCGDNDSELHLIREGDHALDVCVSGNPLLQQLCLAGSAASRDLVAASINQASVWASEVADRRALERSVAMQTDVDGEGSSGTDNEEAVSANGVSTGGGSGVSLFLQMLVLIFLAVRFSRLLGRRLVKNSKTVFPIFPNQINV